MNEVISTLLTSIITAVVPILSACVIVYIKTWRDKTVAETDNTKYQQYITEIADAVSAAVTATSQTYVDALKKNGEFTAEAQQEALKKALAACVASISPAAQTFITAIYGDLTEYLLNRIEAEVRNQKLAVTQ